MYENSPVTKHTTIITVLIILIVGLAIGWTVSTVTLQKELKAEKSINKTIVLPENHIGIYDVDEKDILNACKSELRAMNDALCDNAFIDLLGLVHTKDEIMFDFVLYNDKHDYYAGGKIRSDGSMYVDIYKEIDVNEFEI